MTAPREESPRRRTDRPARPAARAPGREQAPAGAVPGPGSWDPTSERGRRGGPRPIAEGPEPDGVESRGQGLQVGLTGWNPMTERRVLRRCARGAFPRVAARWARGGACRELGWKGRWGAWHPGSGKARVQSRRGLAERGTRGGLGWKGRGWARRGGRRKGRDRKRWGLAGSGPERGPGRGGADSSRGRKPEEPEEPGLVTEDRKGRRGGG